MIAANEVQPHVLIVGAGFGGLTAAQRLGHAEVRVTLVDRTNHHTFQPLLYQVATAGLSPADIAQPIRAIVARQENTSVLMAEVKRIDLDERRVELSDGTSMQWDFLVVACGAVTSYFGHGDWNRAAPSLKTIEDAIDIRQRVLLAFELAEREPDAARRQDLLSFVVIGGGPTGVELAGALSELSRFALSRDFRRADPSHTKVRLIEAGPRILPTFPEDLAASALRQLTELGVEVRTGAPVSRIEPGRVQLGDDTIACSVALWAAGVQANVLTRTLGVPVDKMGRVLVANDLRVPGHSRVFVIGDAARLDGKDGKPLPGVSPVAMQQGRAVARSIQRIIAGNDAIPFEYLDKGSMATVGRSRAIAQVGRAHMTGFIAWLAWLVVHIFYLIGFKNRLVVLISWAWSYVTYRRGARLITGYAAPTAIETPALLAASERSIPHDAPSTETEPPQAGPASLRA